VLKQNYADKALFAQLHSEIEAQMKKAVEFAIAAPYPKLEEVDQDVYA